MTHTFTILSLIAISLVTNASGKDWNQLFPQPKLEAQLGKTPNKTTLLSPDFMQKVTADKVPLKWKDVSDAPEYHLQVATDPNFKWLIVDQNNIKESKFEVTGLESGKTYFWRVSAVNTAKVQTHQKSYFVQSSFVTK